MREPLPDDLLTPAQAARLLGCSLGAVYRRVLSGRLRSQRWGRERHAVARPDVLDLARDLARPPGPRGHGRRPGRPKEETLER